MVAVQKGFIRVAVGVVDCSFVVVVVVVIRLVLVVVAVAAWWWGSFLALLVVERCEVPQVLGAALL